MFAGKCNRVRTVNIQRIEWYRPSTHTSHLLVGQVQTTRFKVTTGIGFISEKITLAIFLACVKSPTVDEKGKSGQYLYWRMFPLTWQIHTRYTSLSSITAMGTRLETFCLYATTNAPYVISCSNIFGLKIFVNFSSSSSKFCIIPISCFLTQPAS